MKIFNSILIKLILLVALVEFLIMLAYEYVAPLHALIEKYTFLGPIIDTSSLTLIITIAYFLVFKKPLDVLIKAIVAIRRGDFSARANAKRKDEIGILASAFNEMVDSIKSYQEKIQTQNEELIATNEELKSANEELRTTTEELQSTNEELKQTNEELRVATEDLKQTNEELVKLKTELEKRVEERTRDTTEAKQTLEKKVADLERFNKVAVGRELAMKELKERIKELEEKLSGKS